MYVPCILIEPNLVAANKCDFVAYQNAIVMMNWQIYNEWYINWATVLGRSLKQFDTHRAAENWVTFVCWWFVLVRFV